MKANPSGFYITGGKGFHVTFENRWTVSVQFGPGNYCDNYYMQIGADEKEAGAMGSSTAECACWPAEGGLQPMRDGNTVQGHMTPAEVLALMLDVAARGTDLGSERYAPRDPALDVEGGSK